MLSKEDKIYINGLIARFTAERPMIVTQVVYTMLKDEGLVPDERIILQKELSSYVNGYPRIKKGK